MDEEPEIEIEVLSEAPFVVPDITGVGCVDCPCGMFSVTCSDGPEGTNVVATCLTCGLTLESRAP